jgi:hypothetical protein
MNEDDKRDAERYRYLRTLATWNGTIAELHFSKDTIDMPFGQTPESFDLAVDRAMPRTKPCPKFGVTITEAK